MTLEINKLRLSMAEQHIVDDLDKTYPSMLETLLDWSAQNSGSYNRDGLDKMRQKMVDYFADFPGKVTELPLAHGNHITEQGKTQQIEYAPALQVKVRPEAPIQLVLTGHYDTVFPKGSHFQTPKYIDDLTINGPGTADMKGGIIIMAEALRAMERSDHASHIGYSILLSPDEEIGSPGSAPLLAELGRASHVGLTFEPALADGSMAGARKGSGNFVLTVRGKAAHAGREHHLGRNAIAAMAEFTMGLEALNGQREGVTFNMAKIDGGGPVNVVPDLAIGRFNVRMLEADDMQWIESQINTLLSHINAKDGLNADLSGGFTRPPKPMAPANATVFNWVKQAGNLLGQDIKWAPSGGVCEGNNLWASGCPNVDTLGVRGGLIHSDQEFTKLDSLVERARLSSVILMKIASGEFDAHHVKKLALEDHKC